MEVIVAKCLTNICLTYLMWCCFSFRTTLSTTVRRAKSPNVKRTRTEPVRDVVIKMKFAQQAQRNKRAHLNLVFPDSSKNSPSSDSPLSAEKEKSKRSKSSSKEKAESVKPERTSSGGKKVKSPSSVALSPDLSVEHVTDNSNTFSLIVPLLMVRSHQTQSKFLTSCYSQSEVVSWSSEWSHTATSVSWRL